MCHLTANPTAPRPKIATEDPGSTFASFHAAPTPAIFLGQRYKITNDSPQQQGNVSSLRHKPVEAPQLSRQASAGGMAGLTLTTWFTSTTVYSVKLDTPRKWWSGRPWPSLNRVVPSRGIPGRTANGYLEHMLLRADLQSTHSLHCSRNVGTTASPAANSSTCSPTLSTTLHRRHAP